MSGVLARILYALLLAGILGAAAWISFSRFVLGKAEEVPDLTGRSVDEATALAAERGLRVVVDATQEGFDEEIPAHRVRGQSPAAGMAVKAGQDLRVFLSLGPRVIQAPDLAGLTARTAALALAREGLVEGAVSAARMPGPQGVVAQGVVPGAPTEPETPVDVLVNRGAPDVLYVMPDLIGRDFERVRLAFEARGFRLGGVKAQPYEGAAAGTILRQFPLAGAPVGLRDTLSFVVASPEPQPG
ncbi:MAG TPA: PASTA domain-containing protein [Thermoanaerobaculia bacterium]|jgi:serine/threonine-protein kinase|nr:PASTA domain-containing protein [Thermoanaerobaculia bacterium]HPA50635.1 PASTA domain-containing protein [Thermoanaerobaculia bacterium]HQN06383.1 PASTA domain-containing protein [Thermoanaerobaculia bacterium]HQP85650.1 PASTA domain-containing protein [Thermoanaerobaculia bacterium]